MVPSAIRTLSVLTLLSAVTGTVVLTQQGGAAQAQDASLAGAAFQPSTIARPQGEERASRSAPRTALEASASRSGIPRQASPLIDTQGHHAEVRWLQSERAADIRDERAEAAAERARKKAAAEKLSLIHI